LGGLARKASIINQEKSKGSHVLVFDTGDAFFLDDTKYNDDTRKIHAEIIAKSYTMMGCNSLAPGLRDFNEFGYSYLDQLKKIGGLNFTSCNIYDSTKSKRLFNEYGTVDIAGFKISYIGASSVFQSSDMHIKEPISQIEKTVSKVSKESDFIILLFNGTDSDLDRLQNSEIDIDMILFSKSNGRTNSQASSNGGKKRIPVFTSGNRGKYLNKISVSLNDNASNLLDISREKNTIRASKKFLDNKNKINTKKVKLEEFYKDNKKVLNDIVYHRSKIASSNKKIDNVINGFETEKVPLNAKVDSNPDVLSVVDEGMSKIVKGPPTKDHKGRKPGDPHHGHNH